MSLKFFAPLSLLLASISTTYAHGTVKSFVIDGKQIQGYDVDFAPYQKTAPVVAGWSMPSVKDHGFVTDVKSPDIICHRGATPGGTYANIAAGAKLTLNWEKNWPHDGPLLTYMANCNGECEKVDKTQLKFFKIDQLGLVDPRPALPQGWATDKIKASGGSWTVTIPSDIAPGNYVVRHETIALHEAQNNAGAQFYPQCINLAVTGTGTANPIGVAGTSLYNANDPGVKFNMYYPVPKSYSIPGPPLYSGAQTSPQESGTPSQAGSSPSASASAVQSTLTAAPSASGLTGIRNGTNPYQFYAVNQTTPSAQSGTYATLTQTQASKKHGHKSLGLSSSVSPALPTATATASAKADGKGKAEFYAAKKKGECSAEKEEEEEEEPTPTVHSQSATPSKSPAVFAAINDSPSLTGSPPSSTAINGNGASATPTYTDTIPLPTVSKTPVVVPIIPADGGHYTYLPLNVTTPTNMTGLSVNTKKLNETAGAENKLPASLPGKVTLTDKAPLIPADASWAEFWDWLQEVVKNHWYSLRKNGKGKEDKHAKRHSRDFQFGYRY
ncbi:MAG: hypothetical protein M1814_005080 [Vezdaea aestivalis]|nr:MAG: hypothetical protein M1814_005080 [Vezdaea aestivalis]